MIDSPLVQQLPSRNGGLQLDRELLALNCMRSTQAFADILASNENFTAPMEDTYKLLDLNPEETTTLEQYLQVGAAFSGAAVLLVIICSMSA